VLIMTSYASLRSAVDSMKMGAVDYIAKPFDHDEMLQAVARILRDRQSPRPRTGAGNAPAMARRQSSATTAMARSASSAPARRCRTCTARSAKSRRPTPMC
jgi:DNA-binding NtrC family response regulator